MSALTTTSTAVTGYSREKVELIKRQVAKGATDDELALFLHYCKSQGFDPLDRDVYFTKRKNNKTNEYTVAYVTSIDALRARAEDTGLYAGNDDPSFDDEENPKRATVTVYKIVGGVRCGFSATARWDQYYPGDTQGFMWRKMPHLMLGKCAEALALRKAFPKQLKKLYAREEMEQIGPEQEHKEESSAGTIQVVQDAEHTDVPAPEERGPPDSQEFSGYVIKVGRLKNQRLVDCSDSDVAESVAWFKDRFGSKPVKDEYREFVETAEAYLRGKIPF
jgi:phage recombination protein Bet